MKKVFIISLVVLGLGFVSCQKQEIVPNSDEMEVPTWDSNARSGDDSIDIGIDGGVDDGGVGGITDPNDENDNPTEEGTNGKTKKRKGHN